MSLISSPNQQNRSIALFDIQGRRIEGTSGYARAAAVIIEISGNAAGGKINVRQGSRKLPSD
jgi:hypothetical protein